MSMSFFKTDFSIVFVTNLEPDPNKELCGGKTSPLLTDVEVRGQFIYEHELILRRLYNLCCSIKPVGEKFALILTSAQKILPLA